MNVADTQFLWLEITGQCNPQCRHCYANGSPYGTTHGAMRLADWKRVIAEASELGCRNVQFIGSEPTLHPDLPEMIRYAFHRGMAIEVSTNLVTVRPVLWDIFVNCRVSLATSFYSVRRRVHEEITQNQHSFYRTISNIRRALSLGLHLRVGLVELRDDQDIEATRVFLRQLGVTRIGRGSSSVSVALVEELKGLIGTTEAGHLILRPEPGQESSQSRWT